MRTPKPNEKRKPNAVGDGRADANRNALGTSGTCCCRCLSLLNGIYQPTTSHEAIKMSKITKFEEKHMGGRVPTETRWAPRVHVAAGACRF